MPLPTLCPVERARRRIAFYPSVTTLYQRKCDITGKDLVTFYHPDTPIKVYDREYWFSDKFDPMEYGRDFDFSKSFFEQFRDLLWEVPKYHSININSENCEYSLMVAGSKNCYLLCGVDSQDVMYMGLAIRGRDSLDCDSIYNCELCYECLNCEDCYDIKFSEHSKNCRNSLFLDSCTDCHDCIMCTGLQHKSYCIKNKQLSKEEYEQEKKKYYLGSRKKLEELQNEFAEFLKLFPVRENHNSNCENVTGDLLKNAVNCHMCFHGENSRDCSYCFPYCNSLVNCYDSSCGVGEYCYEVSSGLNPSNCKFSENLNGGGNNLEYCIHIESQCHDLFGCVGIKSQKEYCILNKQYTKEEYFDLRKRIVDHMKTDGEYGEFFPAHFSFFPYHDSMAHEFRPISETDVKVIGGNPQLGEVNIGGEQLLKIHFHSPETNQFVGETYISNDDIAFYRDKNKQKELLEAKLVCRTTGRAFKIQPAELRFYLKHDLPVPVDSFYARQPRRSKKILQLESYDRKCDKCGVDIHTVYGEDYPRKVYCEKCYLDEVV